MNLNLDRLARNVSSDISHELERIGLFFRMFERAKTEESIEHKLEVKNYNNDSNGKKMQDIIGIRIVLYFQDDLDLVVKALKTRFEFLDETIDEATETVFKPNRINLIFRLKENYAQEVEDVVTTKYKHIDTTYEVQIRTIFSEGWHEVEHDLRYKRQKDWEGHADLSRTLNGIYASLETSDWSILSLFDKLSYEHYRSENVEAMLRNKFRLRLLGKPLLPEIIEIINDPNEGLNKAIYKIERKDFLNHLFDNNMKFPLTTNNLVFALNQLYFKNENITRLTPEFILLQKVNI